SDGTILSVAPGAKEGGLRGFFHRCGQPYLHTQGGFTDSSPELLHPSDMLLHEESSAVAVRTGHVYAVGYRTSPHAQEYRDFLEGNGVPSQWVDVENDPLARFLGAPTDVEGVRLPVFVFPDGSSLEPVEDPDDARSFQLTRAELAERAGLHTRPALDRYDV